MSRNRQTRFITVLFALFSLLFMQLAVAGYACPGYGPKLIQQSQMAAMAEAGMPCAESMALSMDAEQPQLCQAHCQAGQQSADKYQPPAPVAIERLPVNFTLQNMQTGGLASEPVPGDAPYLQRTTAPPIAIRNCCFRI